MTNLVPLLDRLAATEAVLDLSLTFDDIAGSFTCTEANTIAVWMRAHGRPQQADTFLEAHAHSDDDEQDLHGQLKPGGATDA